MTTRILNQTLLLEITNSELRALLMDNGGVPIFVDRIHHANIVEGGHIKDPQSLSSLIVGLLKKIPHKVKRLALALGDDIAFTRVYTPSPDLKKEGWEKALLEEIQNTLPIDGDNIYWDSITIFPESQSNEDTLKKKTTIVYTSALKEDVQNIKDIEKETGLSVLFIDVASLAQARSLLTAAPSLPPDNPSQQMGTMVVSLGEATAALNMYDHHSILQISGIAPFPGGQFTQNIVNEIIKHIDSPSSFPTLLDQRPHQNKTHDTPPLESPSSEGTPPAPTNNKTTPKPEQKTATENSNPPVEGSSFEDSLSVLQLALEAVISEIKKASRYYSEKTGGVIGNILLSGGPALIPGIDSYVQEKVGIPVTLGNPTQHLSSTELFKKEYHQLLFTTPIGLGIRIMHDPEQGINLGKKKTLPQKENKVGQQKNESDFIGPRTVKKVETKSKKIFGITFALITVSAFGFILYKYLIIPMISG